VSLSHGAYDSEAITILSNIEIGQQNIELVSFYFGECFRDAGRNSYLKATSLQDGRKSGPNPFLVIYEKKPSAM